MRTMKDEAITLRRLDYSESSQVLVFLTRLHGPQRLIAKGIKRGTKKKFAVGIDLLERGQVVYIGCARGEGLGTLTEWRQLDLHLGLRSDLPQWYAAQYAAEITAGMTEQEDPHPELYDALAALLGALNGESDPLPLVIAYQSAVLTATGLWPDLTRCVICDRPAPPGRAAYFSAHQGGLVCRACEGPLVEKRKVSAATLTALREGSFEGQVARGVFELLDYTIAHALGRAPALSRFLAFETGRGLSSAADPQLASGE
jgi:DNA repair protein RecO (recombination protein O)